MSQFQPDFSSSRSSCCSTGNWPRRAARSLLLARSLGIVFFLATAPRGFLIPSNAQDQKKTQEFDLTGDRRWLDTQINLQPGDLLRMSASGTLQYPQSIENGPEGLPRGWRDLLRALPLNEANRGAVIGRIGEESTGRPFLIGPARESRVTVGGSLYLGINQKEDERPEGKYRVKVEVTPRGAAPAKVDESRLPRLTQNQLDQIPTRVSDPGGILGDRVNFLIVGSEEKMQEALRAAGWTKVNRTVKEAFIQGALATLSRQAYTQMPMSDLRLFDRPQDYGYAMADPIAVIVSRHHFRLWKAPFQADGQTIWVGAGTHDIGLEKDKRNGKLTHKIDPEVDKERDFMAKSLENAGMTAKLSYMTPAVPVTEAKTASGAAYRSDGKVNVIILNPDDNDVSESFADIFCSVLREKNPDGGEWGDCSRYLEASSKKSINLGALSNQYRLLIVPGLMNTCFAGAPAFKEGQAYLSKTYNLSVDLLPVRNDSCEDNARKIAEYLAEKMKGDSRKYIVLGYSKGAPDVQVALASDPAVVSSVAAFVSVAGAVGGSIVADSIPGQADRWIRQYNLPKCQGDLSQGFKSLSQAARRAFLASHPDPLVPSYSLAAVSSKENTSKMLVQTWQILSAFTAKQDSQLTKTDALVPGSKYLGSALADHFAVALPFESSNESMRSGADKNHYPRSALLETIVRFVIQDLQTKK